MVMGMLLKNETIHNWNLKWFIPEKQPNSSNIIVHSISFGQTYTFIYSKNYVSMVVIVTAIS